MTPLVTAAASAPPPLVRSLIGKKVIMAVTVVILLLFAIAPLVGNLKVCQGAEHFNAYAESLRTLGAPFFPRGLLLWVARVVLLVAVFAHIWAAIAVTRASWGARPVGYHGLAVVETTYAARTMRWGRVSIVLYVIYHLLDFTFGRVKPSFVPRDAYHNPIASFPVWPVSAGYVVAMVVVGLHVYHGLWSAFQTLGLNRPPTSRGRRSVAGAGAGLIVVGYISVPGAGLPRVLR